MNFLRPFFAHRLSWLIVNGREVVCLITWRPACGQQSALATQQYLLLQRNLICTEITRGKRLVVVVGQRKALAIAARNNRTEQRF